VPAFALPPPDFKQQYDFVFPAPYESPADSSLTSFTLENPSSFRAQLWTAFGYSILLLAVFQFCEVFAEYGFGGQQQTSWIEVLLFIGFCATLHLMRGAMKMVSMCSQGVAASG
jgi:hypothetical protein